MDTDGIPGKTYLMAEFVLLCIGVPTIMIIWTYAPFMFAFLWGATLYCYIVYRNTYSKRAKALWRWHVVTWDNLKPMLIRWVIASIAMLAFTYYFVPDKLFNIFHRNPSLIPWLMVMYPVLSALPQEFIFCNFFFRRYEPFFGRGKLMIFMSALVFAFAHMLYINPIAPTISFIGGLIFADTFARHRSLALVTIEHGLYGNTLFLVGLGWYFYSGAVTVHP